MGVDNKALAVGRGLIVSCQTFENEALQGSEIVALMAKAAEAGGAIGLRVNGVEDIEAVRQVSSLPLIAIAKVKYEGYETYITPTMKEVDELMALKPEIIAVDATRRPHPSYAEPGAFIRAIKDKYDVAVMADVSTLEEGIFAWQAGADIIATTLSGYTPYTMDRPKPDIALVKALAEAVDVPVVAEGNVHIPEQALQCLQAGAHAVVVGSAITRPQFLTQRFAEKMQQGLND